MLKKLKEEKEKKKEMVVRNLKKAKVIQEKQKIVKKQSGVLNEDLSNV